MRYKYREGISENKKTNKLWLFLPIIGVCAGVYLLINVLSPGITYSNTDPQMVAKKLVATMPKVGENRLYIPQINVDVAIVDIDGNETLALEKGAIHRSPISGNAKEGGNFVLAAHRFNLGLTPDLTRAKSPFYHIDKMKNGDQLYVDYKGVRYAYEVTEKKRVPETAVEIEQRTTEDQLTLYSCELTGPKDGREVVIAKPIGTVAWENGKSVVKAKSL